jgi:tetratricopeptide (TPR) repeat protein
MDTPVAANWLSGPPGPSTTYSWDLWVLRERLSTADQAIVLAIHGIGPNFPEPCTRAELIAAAERAARLNPDNAEAFFLLGNLLVVWGRQAAAANWLSRGVVAIDSAIVLDPSLIDATWTRLYAALVYGESADIRRAASLYSASSEGDDRRDALRWVVARALSDSVALSQARVGLGLLTSRTANTLVGASVWHGLPLGEVDEILAASLSRYGLTAGERCHQQALRVVLAAVRGRPSEAVAVADSASACNLDFHLAGLALVEPGYEAAAERFAQRFPVPAEASSYNGLCYAELLRVARGDTTRTWAAAARIDVLVREPDVRVYEGHGLCARVLEAALEAGATSTPALSRLDRLHRGGTGLQAPGEAGLLLARWLEARGDTAGALAAVRRRQGNWSIEALRVLPAVLREEGRLSELTGDTAAAVLAYEHYLRLRDAPEPGPMSDEVRRVQAHLATLVRAGDGTGGVSRRSRRPM